MQIISVLQLDNLACFYQGLSGYSTARLADKDTLSLVGSAHLPNAGPAWWWQLCRKAAILSQHPADAAQQLLHSQPRNSTATKTSEQTVEHQPTNRLVAAQQNRDCARQRTWPMLALYGGGSCAARLPYSPSTQQMQHSRISGSKPPLLLPAAAAAAAAPPLSPAAAAPPVDVVPLSKICRHIKRQQLDTSVWKIEGFLAYAFV
jgi:hypothetical protein